MKNLKTRIAKNSKKLTRKIVSAPKMAAVFDVSKFISWKKYSKGMAASIITTWSLKMINKMRSKENDSN